MSGGSVDISGSLIHSVRAMFYLALETAPMRQGINGWTPHALSGYVSSIASFEALLNESFLVETAMCRHVLRTSPLWGINQDDRENESPG